MAKKRGSKYFAFVPLLWEVLNNQVYISLPHSAAKALPYFIGKVKIKFDDPERYRMEFSFTYREAKRYGFSPSTFSKAIQSLVAYGLIDPVDKGGLRSDCKSSNKFCLSLRWKDYGKPEFKALNWKCFCPKPRLKATSKKEINRFKKGNKRGET